MRLIKRLSDLGHSMKLFFYELEREVEYPFDVWNDVKKS